MLYFFVLFSEDKPSENIVILQQINAGESQQISTVSMFLPFQHFSSV